MRAVLDVNVLISALLSAQGAPARLLVAWQAGEFELIVSPLLLAELSRALGYPKLRRLVPAGDAVEYVDWLGRSATLVQDSAGTSRWQSQDPADDYLLALAAQERALLVSGDTHVLALADDLPIHTPAHFVELLEKG